MDEAARKCEKGWGDGCRSSGKEMQQKGGKDIKVQKI